MINLPAFQLNNKLTKVEKENIQAMSIWKKYKKELANANDMKACYKRCKEVAALGVNLEAKKAEIYFYNEALKSWNISQELLSEYNEFQLNRKYK
jgi:hypothetical protein